MSEENNIFLHTLGQMNRDMYTDKATTESQPSNPSNPVSNFQFDETLLVKKDNTGDTSRLVINLQEENKSLKEKMKFVIEKDEEIYRLQCEKKQYEMKYSKLQSETVTDESLLTDNNKLTQDIRKLKASYETKIKELKQHSDKLSNTILVLDHKIKDMEEIENNKVLFQTHVIKQTLNPLQSEVINKDIEDILETYQLMDHSYINKYYIENIIQEIIIQCRMRSNPDT